MSSVPAGDSRMVVIRWVILLVASLGFAALFEWMRLPAALLLGPMLAAILCGIGGAAVALPRPAFLLAQGFIGVLMARALPPTVMGEMLAIWPVLIVGVVAVVASANLIGYAIARLGILPGTTAVWGASPGAATAMVIMAEAYGADMRLVALMQYLRVIIVATAASLAARFYLDVSITGGSTAAWFPTVDGLAFAETLAVILGGLVISQLFRLSTGAMILPMLFAIGLQGAGLVHIELPPSVLALSYAVCGWSIGFRFNRAILVHALKALPTIIAAIVFLVVLCAVYALVLMAVTGVDFMTAYLAMSPGGADSVAIIAASSGVDMPFVMAMQTMRFFLVLLTGPATARFIADRVS